MPRKTKAGPLGPATANTHHQRHNNRHRTRVNGFGSVHAAIDRLGTPTEVLRRHGVQVRGRMARCPLHADNAPSVSLFDGRDGKPRWKCHGCGRSGDAIDLEAALSGRTVRDLLS